MYSVRRGLFGGSHEMTTQTHDDDDDRVILKALEECVEEQVLRLPILSILRRTSALVRVATAFENALRLRGETPSAMVVGLKYGLNHLVAWVQDNCPSGDPSASVNVSSDAYSTAREALVFAYDYDWILSAYRRYFHGRAKLDIRPPILRFIDLHTRADDRRLIDHALWRARRRKVSCGAQSPC